MPGMYVCCAHSRFQKIFLSFLSDFICAANEDYIGLSVVLIYRGGKVKETTHSFNVTILDDSQFNNSMKQFTIVAQAVKNAFIPQPVTTVSILDYEICKHWSVLNTLAIVI